jgi:hypothetical protein
MVTSYNMMQSEQQPLRVILKSSEASPEEKMEQLFRVFDLLLADALEEDDEP